MSRVKITVVLVDRANYGRLKPVLEEMREHPGIELQIVVTGSMLLDRFGSAVKVVEKDGFDICERIYNELEGSVPATMVKSMGLAIIELGNAFERLKPDFVLVIGDRYEALSAAIAAAYHNICLIHLQGGEVTGSIDESARHAITKLAHYHYPATVRAAEYIERMGESRESIFPFGCPSADVVHRAVANGDESLSELLASLGVGPRIDIQSPFLLCLFHPVTTEFQGAEQQMNEVLAALKDIGRQVVLIWPNIDAGADGISQSIRIFREQHPDVLLHAYKNFPPQQYIPLLARAACLVGNSSSFVRDASFLGTPVVLVGSRQDGREISSAVRRVNPSRDEIKSAIDQQIAHGRYPPSDLYGGQGVSRKIVESMVGLRKYAQKRLAY